MPSDCLKLAMVIPIHKKRSKLEVGNYKPISFLSNIEKLLEKVIYERTYSFIENFNPKEVIQQIMHSLQ